MPATNRNRPTGQSLLKGQAWAAWFPFCVCDIYEHSILLFFLFVSRVYTHYTVYAFYRTYTRDPVMSGSGVISRKCQLLLLVLSRRLGAWGPFYTVINARLKILFTTPTTVHALFVSEKSAKRWKILGVTKFSINLVLVLQRMILRIPFWHSVWRECSKLPP